MRVYKREKTSSVFTKWQTLTLLVSHVKSRICFSKWICRSLNVVANIAELSGIATQITRKDFSYTDFLTLSTYLFQMQWRTSLSDNLRNCFEVSKLVNYSPKRETAFERIKSSNGENIFQSNLLDSTRRFHQEYSSKLSNFAAVVGWVPWREVGSII